MNRYEYRVIETFCGECGIATCGFSCGASLPYFEIKIPKADTEAIETYTDTELKMLLKEPDIRKCGFVTYRSWVIVNFLLSTGIRQNSLINIRIKDIDFDNDIVYINTTKNRKSLIIPLNEDIVKILQEYLKYRGGGSDDWLFCSMDLSRSIILSDLAVIFIPKGSGMFR